MGLLAACGQGSGSGASQARSGSGQIEFLTPAFPDGFNAPSMLAAGRPQRIAFVVSDNVDVMREAAPSTLDITITHAGSIVASLTVDRRDAGIITPYYPVVFTPPTPGQYVAEVAGAAPVPFTVVTEADVPLLQVGDLLPSIDTPTVVDPRDVDPICTRAVPCGLHDVSLRDALATGQPTALLVSTPGFCQTDICGPVLDLLINSLRGRPGLTAIHAEVYKNPIEFSQGTFPETTEVVDALRLPYEPQLLVADASGTIVARLDITWDRGELDDALALAQRSP